MPESGRYRPHQGNELKPEERAHLALAASWRIDGAAKRAALDDLLWRSGDLPHLRDVLGPALLLDAWREQWSHPGSLVPGLLNRVLALLTEEVDRPLSPYADWSRPVPAGAATSGTWDGAGLIGELHVFMRDSKLVEYRFRKRESLRELVSQYIRRHCLDLECSLDRSGSPHTLICRKNDVSYRRALAQRKLDVQLLAKLNAIWMG